jgi:hypothetical protein
VKPFAAISIALLFASLQPPSANADEQSLPYKYVGNNFTHVFHKPSCDFAKRIWTTRLELFHFRQDAVDAHYKPCNWCLPQRWWRCSGKLISSHKDSSVETPASPPAPSSATPAPPELSKPIEAEKI